MSLLIRGRQLRLADLLQTREAIEPVCARLAAQNRTDEELTALDDANKALEAADGESLGVPQRQHRAWPPPATTSCSKPW